MRLPKQQTSTAEMIGILLGAVMLLILTPLITIWSINTLSIADIPYNLSTMGAVIWIKVIIAGLLSNVGRNSK